MRERAFFFHYNKPATAAAGGDPRVSFHFQGTCHILRDMRFYGIDIPRRRRSHRQPRYVQVGRVRPDCFEVIDGIGHAWHPSRNDEVVLKLAPLRPPTSVNKRKSRRIK